MPADHEQADHKPPLEKPWAILGITRKKYAAVKPWKMAGMSKEKYAEMLNLFPHEAMKILKDEVDAERLVESIFGSQDKRSTE